MKLERAKVSAEVRNKINGKKYRVVQQLALKSIIREIDPETDECIPDTDLEITEANGIVFRVLKDAPAAMPEGYTIEEGTLLKDGKPAMRTQGSIYILEILFCIPGKILVSAAGDSDSVIDLYEYRPEADHFMCLVKGIEKNAFKTAAISEKMGIWGANIQHKEIFPDGSECDIYDNTILIAFGNKQNAAAIVSNDYVDFTDCSMLEGADGSILLCFQNNSIVNENGVVKTVPNKIEDTSAMVLVPARRTCSEIVKIKGKIESATWSFVHGKEGYFIRTTKELNLNFGEWTIPLTAYIAKELTGYDYLVDVRQKDNIRTFVLANANYEIIEIKSEKTKDRGCIVAIA